MCKDQKPARAASMLRRSQGKLAPGFGFKKRALRKNLWKAGQAAKE
jgi:hypothetical protein